MSGQLSRKEDTVRRDSQDTNSSGTVMGDEMESRMLEEKANPGIPDRGGSENNDQEESGESIYYSDLNSDVAKDGSDDSNQASEMMQINPFTTAAPEEDQMIPPDPRVASLPMPPLEKLPDEWAKQHSELDKLHSEMKDLEEKIDSLGIENSALQDDLSKVKIVYNQLEPTNQRLKDELEKYNLDNEKLRELNEDLRRMLHERVMEVGYKNKEISQTNDERRREQNVAADAVQAREKTIEALKADARKSLGIALASKMALKAEVNKLKEALKKEQERNNELVAEQRERARVIPQTPTAEQDSKETLLSLEDEMWASESVDAGERDKGEEAHIRTIEGELKAAQSESSVARKVEHSSTTWWLLLLCLALSWWFSQGDQQLWMQANEITRQRVVELRDERWAEPAWLARMRFDADNMLEIDRSMFT